MINTVKIKVKKLSEDAIIPTIGSEHSAGFDIYTNEEYELKPGETHTFTTGLSFEIPEGKVFLIWDRSSLGAKGLHRFAGVIDSDYRGELKVVIFNSTNTTYRINKGDRICQGIIQDYYRPFIEEVKELSNTNRGIGGFGSTGK
ncbi:MAG: dUTP diphosphatase [Candidatus Pacearchaeota archaeon]